MSDDSLVAAESAAFDVRYGPPRLAAVRATNTWIVEWLGNRDRKTGRELHAWMQQRRPGWSAYFPCRSKADLLDAVERATKRAQSSAMVPVLHFEAHGDEFGIGPNQHQGLQWEELTKPLQELNTATKCNLVVLFAACVGFAGVKAFQRGPRAPAVALVGPSASVGEGDLLRGTKEFYRRWIDGDAKLAEIADGASREATVEFGIEPFALLAFEAIKSALAARIRQDALVVPREVQRMWDEMLMIDLWPENRQRFGLDMSALVAGLRATIDSR